MRDTRDLFGYIFGQTLRIAAVNRPGKGHFPVTDQSFHLCRVNKRVISQPVINIFSDTVIWTPVAFRPASAEHTHYALTAPSRVDTLPLIVHSPSSVCLFITKPGADLITHSLKEAPVFLSTPALTLIVIASVLLPALALTRSIARTRSEAFTPLSIVSLATIVALTLSPARGSTLWFSALWPAIWRGREPFLTIASWAIVAIVSTIIVRAAIIAIVPAGTIGLIVPPITLSRGGAGKIALILAITLFIVIAPITFTVVLSIVVPSRHIHLLTFTVFKTFCFTPFLIEKKSTSVPDRAVLGL
jgi:hypothetical protein